MLLKKIHLLLLITTLIVHFSVYSQENKQCPKYTDVLSLIETQVNKDDETLKYLNLNTLDCYLDKIAQHAESYPPKFKTEKEKQYIEKVLHEILGLFLILDEPKSTDIDFLWRYGRASAIGHNLDFRNADHKAIDCFDRALTINSNHIETNYHWVKLQKWGKSELEA